MAQRSDRGAVRATPMGLQHGDGLVDRGFQAILQPLRDAKVIAAQQLHELEAAVTQVRASACCEMPTYVMYAYMTAYIYVHVNHMNHI